MIDDIDLLNHWLAQASDDDKFLFVRYPVKMNEVAITKRDLLTGIKPALLPEPPSEPPPILPPPSVPDPATPPAGTTTEVMAVAAQDGLSIRGGPNVLANWLAKLPFNAVVEVEKRTVASGRYIWSVLLKVNGLKYPQVGYVARGTADGSETYLVKASAPA